MNTSEKERRMSMGRRKSDRDGTLEIKVKVKEKVATPIFILLCLSVALNAIGLLGIWFITDDTNQVVEDIETKSSPEAVAAQEEFINSILLRVECSDRRISQDILDALIEQGVLSQGSVTVLTDNCPPG